MASLSGLIAICAFGLASSQWPQSRRRYAPPSSKSFSDAILGKMQDIIARYGSQYPDLALSVAWKDEFHDISLTLGNVSGKSITPQDTFLYGSGTKPFTAVAVLRLIDEGKVKATDKVSAIVDPYLKAHGKPALAHFLGESINSATVLQLIRMNAGIRDYEDSYDLDKLVLENGTAFWDIPYDAMKFSVSSENIQGGVKAGYKGIGSGPLYCDPGACTAYSSTSFLVAGLVLVAVLQPSMEWYEFDLGSAVFDNRSEYPSLSFPPKAETVSAIATLKKHLTTPGSSVATTWPRATIYEQDPSILGFTCGNMVGSPHDIAKFYYNLFNDLSRTGGNWLISDQSRREMTNFQILSAGWNAGYMQYGAGLMNMYYGTNRHPNIWVSGHEGDTYGFVSSQGYAPSLKGAYSVVTNIDNSGPMESLTYQLLSIATDRLVGEVSSPVMASGDRLAHHDQQSKTEMIVV